MTNGSAKLHGRTRRGQFTPATLAAAVSMFVLLAASGARAAVTTYSAALDVAQATTAQPGATGSGAGTFSYESTTMELTYSITYTGLAFAESISHIHSGAAGVPGPVEVSLPNGTPKDGMAVLSPAQENALMADGLYVNIHTSNSSGGAIRGQIIMNAPIPALGRSALAVLALLLCAGGCFVITRMRPLS